MAKRHKAIDYLMILLILLGCALLGEMVYLIWDVFLEG